MLASPLVASVAFAPKRRLIHNDVAARLYGDKHHVLTDDRLRLLDTFPKSPDGTM